MLILEVGPVEGPEWEVDIKVAVKGNGEARVPEASSHFTKFLREGGVYAETVYI